MRNGRGSNADIRATRVGCINPAVFAIRGVDAPKGAVEGRVKVGLGREEEGVEGRIKVDPREVEGIKGRVVHKLRCETRAGDRGKCAGNEAMTVAAAGVSAAGAASGNDMLGKDAVAVGAVEACAAGAASCPPLIWPTGARAMEGRMADVRAALWRDVLSSSSSSSSSSLSSSPTSSSSDSLALVFFFLFFLARGPRGLSLSLRGLCFFTAQNSRSMGNVLTMLDGIQSKNSPKTEIT
jgi:hypothetical protein